MMEEYLKLLIIDFIVSHTLDLMASSATQHGCNQHLILIFVVAIAVLFGMIVGLIAYILRRSNRRRCNFSNICSGKLFLLATIYLKLVANILCLLKNTLLNTKGPISQNAHRAPSRFIHRCPPDPCQIDRK